MLGILNNFFSWFADLAARLLWPSKCISREYSPLYQFTVANLPDLSFANFQPPPALWGY